MERRKSKYVQVEYTTLCGRTIFFFSFIIAEKKKNIPPSKYTFDEYFSHRLYYSLRIKLKYIFFFSLFSPRALPHFNSFSFK